MIFVSFQTSYVVSIFSSKYFYILWVKLHSYISVSRYSNIHINLFSIFIYIYSTFYRKYLKNNVHQELCI
jgi:hypothetical protein